jgi:hypothetical protein
VDNDIGGWLRQLVEDERGYYEGDTYRTTEFPRVEIPSGTLFDDETSLREHGRHLNFICKRPNAWRDFVRAVQELAIAGQSSTVRLKYIVGLENKLRSILGKPAITQEDLQSNTVYPLYIWGLMGSTHGRDERLKPIVG